MFWVAMEPDAHNMKCPYQCPSTDLHVRLYFLRTSWHEKPTIYGDGCAQNTEMGLDKLLILTFTTS